MNLRLALFRACPRGFIRRRMLRALTDATAAAFECEPPRSAGRGYLERLAAYAEFTASMAGGALYGECDVVALQTGLRERAYNLGSRLRSRLRLADLSETMAAARVVYGMLGIDFSGDSNGLITVRRCYFSRFYAPEVCRLVSALDEGVLAGLAGDGRLTFRERITEGAGRCRACFSTVGALA